MKTCMIVEKGNVYFWRKRVTSACLNDHHPRAVESRRIPRFFLSQETEKSHSRQTHTPTHNRVWPPRDFDFFFSTFNADHTLVTYTGIPRVMVMGLGGWRFGFQTSFLMTCKHLDLSCEVAFRRFNVISNYKVIHCARISSENDRANIYNKEKTISRSKT